jgi:hypothetical protein
VKDRQRSPLVHRRLHCPACVQRQAAFARRLCAPARIKVEGFGLRPS